MSDQIINTVAQTVDGVLIKNPKTRGVFASIGAWVAGGLSATSAGVGALVATGWHAPAWVIPTIGFAYVVYGAFAAYSHGIWKANIK